MNWSATLLAINFLTYVVSQSLNQRLSTKSLWSFVLVKPALVQLNFPKARFGPNHSVSFHPFTLSIKQQQF